MHCALGKLALVASSPSMCLSPAPGLWPKDIAYAKKSSLPSETDCQRQPCLPTWNHAKTQSLLQIRHSIAFPFPMNPLERHTSLNLLLRLFLIRSNAAGDEQRKVSQWHLPSTCL